MYASKIMVLLGLLAFTLAPHGKETARDWVSEAMPTIERANSDWVTAMRNGDLDMIVKPYGEDAVFVTAGGESIRGREAIKSFYRERLKKAAIVSASIHHQGAATAEDGLVYEWGMGTVGSRSANGTVTTGGGPYLTVWKRDQDGAWKILRNVVL